MIPISLPDVAEDTIREVSEVLRSGRLSAGPWVAAFESGFSNSVSCQFGVATSSGTTALLAALYAVGVRAHDTVITTPFSFAATANSIKALGAVPTFCDVDLETGNLNEPELIENIEKLKPKAVLIVHLYGNPMRLGRIRDACGRIGVKLVEDCAQAHGAMTDVGPVGSVGDAAAFSFYATKNLAIGEGGMVTTNDPDVARRCQQLVNHGQASRYCHVAFGLNFRMMDLQGLIGLRGLDALGENNRKRARHAAFIRTHVGPKALWVNTGESVYHQLTLRTPRRDKLAEWLSLHDVGYGIYYPVTIPDQPAFRDTDQGMWPNARTLASEVISVPVHPRLTAADLARVAQTLKEFPD